jgi:hypothetical protein
LSPQLHLRKLQMVIIAKTRVPLTGVGSGISRLVTDNCLARSALPQRANTSLCKQVLAPYKLVIFGCAPRAIARSDQGQKRPLSGRLPRYGNGARLRADCLVEDRRTRPAIPRSMSFYDTCVAPRYRNGPTGRRRLTGAEAFELERMDPCYIDIDGFWPKGADSKGPESVPIAN